MGKTDAIEIKLSLDESNSSSLVNGQEALINDVIAGTITEISPTASLTTGKINFTVVAPNTDDRLNPGDIGRVTITRVIPINNAITLPLSTITIGQDESFVFVVETKEDEEKNVVAKRQVVLGDTYDDHVVIKLGLNEGDVVIKKNGIFLSVGDAVTIITE